MADDVCGLTGPLCTSAAMAVVMLLSTEGVFRVSIDCNDATWAGHLEL